MLKKKTVFHILQQNKVQDMMSQAPGLFPFLTSNMLSQCIQFMLNKSIFISFSYWLNLLAQSAYAKQQVKFKKINSVINHKNIDTIIPQSNNHDKQAWKNSHQIKQFLFFGRSNVGKSSLLNSLMQQTIAPISKRPGKTKQLLVCELKSTEKSYFVDAPGYGYATGVPKAQIGQWGKLIKNYLLRVRNVKQKILCLVDVTHGLKETDALLFDMLKKMKKNFQIVFTKCDKMEDQDIKKGLKIAIMIRQNYQDMDFYAHFTSSKQNKGIEQLRNHIMFTIIGQHI